MLCFCVSGCSNGESKSTDSSSSDQTTSAAGGPPYLETGDWREFLEHYGTFVDEFETWADMCLDVAQRHSANPDDESITQEYTSMVGDESTLWTDRANDYSMQVTEMRDKIQGVSDDEMQEYTEKTADLERRVQSKSEALQNAGVSLSIENTIQN